MINDNNTIKLIFGFKVKYLRQQKDLSYHQLADITGLSPAYLHEIEKGKKYPKADKIFALAKAFGVDYDYLVSIHASKKLQPIIDLLESDLLKVFPLEEMFGISATKLLELFSNTPDKVNAFIGTIIKIARNYQMRSEHFYNAALRSYQDLHDNYFEDLENAVKKFKLDNEINEKVAYTTAFLEKLLKEKYNITIDRKTLYTHDTLRGIRSLYSPVSNKLLLNTGLTAPQEHFLMGRELAFQYLQMNERPYETIIQKPDTFEKLLNNFKASYFSVALLMDENIMIADIKQWASMDRWESDYFARLFDKYGVTAEMFIQRMTNILPKHFGIKDLFFLRIAGNDDLRTFRMTKELHLSQIHNPHANELNEHYCQRWVSINILKKLRLHPAPAPSLLVEAQLSKYWETDNMYLCLSVAKPSVSPEKESVSVTLGLLVNDDLKALLKFLGDPAIKFRQVHTTCERCSMPDCNERIAPPTVIEREKKSLEVEKLLLELRNKG
jgi:XRE family transcriptional regulator, fatty acid utilization regulator